MNSSVSVKLRYEKCLGIWGNAKAFDEQYLNDLIGQAKDSPRLRQHRNIHQSYKEACQRLFNAIEKS